MPNPRSKNRLNPTSKSVPRAKIMPPAKLFFLSHKQTRIGGTLIPHFDSSNYATAPKVNQPHGRLKTAKVLPAKILLKGRNRTPASSVLPKPLFRGRQTNTYLSILSTKSKCAKKKKKVLMGNKRRSPKAENVSHLTQRKRLLFLQSLLKEPLTYSELHKQFGLSKQTLASLMRNGFIEEVWGKSGVGLKFAITDAGKKLLTTLKESARYDPHIKEIGRFRLNQQIFH